MSLTLLNDDVKNAPCAYAVDCAFDRHAGTNLLHHPNYKGSYKGHSSMVGTVNGGHISSLILAGREHIECSDNHESRDES
jgi:hypothetical protein